MIGKPRERGQGDLRQVRSELPFVAQLASLPARRPSGKANSLYDGARRHWDRWAPERHLAKGMGPCSREEADRRVADPDASVASSDAAAGQRTHRPERADPGRRRGIPSCGCGPAGARASSRCCRCTTRSDCSVTAAEAGRAVAQLGCDGVKLGVPMRVDLKYRPQLGRRQAQLGRGHELPTPIEPVHPVEPSIEIPTEMPRDPPPLETPTPHRRRRVTTASRDDNFDSEISLARRRRRAAGAQQGALPVP